MSEEIKATQENTRETKKGFAELKKALIDQNKKSAERESRERQAAEEADLERLRQIGIELKTANATDKRRLNRERIEGKESRETNKYFPSYTSDEQVLKIGIKGDSTEGKGDSVTGIMHWSATSVSFCMRGTGFPAMEGHSGYTGKIINGEAPNWKAFSLIRNKIIPKVGDVVVKTAGHGRKGTVTTASHGDIIYRIDGDFAYTCGGNVGERGKFKESGYKIKLASDGTVFSPKPYIIILKKMK